MNEEIKNLKKLIKDGFKKIDDNFEGVEKRFDDLAEATARGFEEAAMDRNEIKGGLTRLGLRVDNWYDENVTRLRAVEKKVGIDPGKPKKIIR